MDCRLCHFLFVTILLVAAGCTAPVAADDRPAGPGGLAAAPTGSAGHVASTVEDPNRTGAIVLSVEAAENRTPPLVAVERAAAYWDGDDSTGEHRYVVVRDAPNPDVVVRVADEPLRCGATGDLPDYVCLFDAREGAAGQNSTLVALSPGLTDDGVRSAVTAALGKLAGEPAPFDRPDIDEPAFADPWPASDPVTIRVVDEAGTDRDVAALVRETLGFWERHDDRWGTYTTDWRLVDGRDADLTVAFVDEVERCGDHPTPQKLLGCAPVLHPENLADDDERVRIKAGYDDETTLLVLKHEFGHVYGLSHGDEPTDVMTDSITATRRR